MAIHSGIRDDGVHFQIVPSTRRIVVPTSHKTLGIIGSHNSEQVTFKCPKTIDGHDVVNCSDHYVDWVNANGRDGRFEILQKDITTDDEYMYLTWVIDCGVTASAGFIKFAVHFEDKNSDGAMIYAWGTTECGDCQILDTIKSKSGTTVPVPEGYIKPRGSLAISKNDIYPIAQYEYVDVQVPEPSGTKIITSNGGYSVKDFASAIVSVPSEIEEGYLKPSGMLTIEENGEHDVKEYEKVSVKVPETKLSTTTITSNGQYRAPAGTGYEYVTVRVPETIPAGYIKPTGTRPEPITENGTYIVTQYQQVVVDVPGGGEIPEGYIKPTGTLTISDIESIGKLIDVSQYAYIYIDIPVFDGSVEVG